mmetsp:Transcript_45309/g.117255  ORF Transcript_45309/g.117255 Transcript_45309/m.117255 type:complete len:285 (-) Transcript_45309:835-1689(-)
MSETSAEFTDYNDYSSCYDDYHAPSGLDLFARLLKPSMIGLDAGCGTGTYMIPLAEKVTFVSGLDANEEMIKVCKEKAARRGVSNIGFVQQSVCEKLPFDDSSLDFIMCSHVLCHIDTGKPFPNARRAISEFCRVCKKSAGEGFVAILLTTPEQHRDTFWYSHYNPTGVERYIEREISEQELRSVFEENDFSITDVFHCREPLQGNMYYNLSGVLNKEFRKNDSTWLLAPEEMEGILEKIRQDLEKGLAAQVFLDAERRRIEIGQASIFVARYNKCKEGDGLEH